VLSELLKSLPQVGCVEQICIAAVPRAPMTLLPEAAAGVGTGLAGDHHAKSGKESARQVTLIQAEHLPVIAALCGRADAPPELLRRNIVVSGINLLALKKTPFQIGEAVLEGSGPCAPCSRMEENLGPGGYNATRGHGGITARVIRAGTIRVGDQVRPLHEPEDDNE
jgi:MOSC domain-containing protein YiiM